MSAAKQTMNITQLNNTGLTRRGFLAAVGTSAAGLGCQWPRKTNPWEKKLPGKT